jgi:hypothetical protein
VTNAEKYWWLGPLIAGIAACLVIWFNWGQYRVRRWRLRNAFDAFLAVVPEKGEEGRLTELAVPAHSEFAIQLRIRPKFNFRQNNFMFGFDGDPSKKPRPLMVLNTFIKEGSGREQSPGNNERHHLDYGDYYHIEGERERISPTFYAMGFVVQTREPGTHPVRIEINTGFGEAKTKQKLLLIVEGRPASAKARRGNRSLSRRPDSMDAP